ncbi:MAG TPA: ASCH domain-containing protein [Patescibacteria group bacterium]|nr:ASCH domain-containing protein [Patescibacteria group bacterium]
MKTLKFADNLVPLVLSGEKTRTWRLFDDKDLQIEDDLVLTNKATLKEFAKAKIVAVYEKKLRDITDADFAKHERFQSTEKMHETYRKYYGEQVTLNTLVKVIDFKLL